MHLRVSISRRWPAMQCKLSHQVNLKSRQRRCRAAPLTAWLFWRVLVCIRSIPQTDPTDVPRCKCLLCLMRSSFPSIPRSTSPTPFYTLVLFTSIVNPQHRPSQPRALPSTYYLLKPQRHKNQPVSTVQNTPYRVAQRFLCQWGSPGPRLPDNWMGLDFGPRAVSESKLREGGREQLEAQLPASPDGLLGPIRCPQVGLWQRPEHRPSGAWSIQRFPFFLLQPTTTANFRYTIITNHNWGLQVFTTHTTPHHNPDRNGPLAS